MRGYTSLGTGGQADRVVWTDAGVGDGMGLICDSRGLCEVGAEWRVRSRCMSGGRELARGTEDPQKSVGLKGRSPELSASEEGWLCVPWQAGPWCAWKEVGG